MSKALLCFFPVFLLWLTILFLLSLILSFRPKMKSQGVRLVSPPWLTVQFVLVHYYGGKIPPGPINLFFVLSHKIPKHSSVKLLKEEHSLCGQADVGNCGQQGQTVQ